jgi:hypothetical protein
MPLFNRAKSDEPAPAEAWTIAETELDGAPLILRFNTGAAEVARRSAWPFRLGVAVPFTHPTDAGFAGEEEAGVLDEIEDALAAAVDERGGIFALTLTTAGMREFVAYVRSEADAEPLVAAARSSAGDHEVQWMGQQDKKWTVYDEFKP